MEKSSDTIEEYFKEQLEDEIDIAERAKRIDERLQDFDVDYNVRNFLVLIFNFISHIELSSQTKRK